VRQDPKGRRDRKVTSGPLAPQALLDPPARQVLKVPKDHRAMSVRLERPEQLDQQEQSVRPEPRALRGLRVRRVTSGRRARRAPPAHRGLRVRRVTSGRRARRAPPAHRGHKEFRVTSVPPALPVPKAMSVPRVLPALRVFKAFRASRAMSARRAPPVPTPPVPH
jgi:hypothetical protein